MSTLYWRIEGFESTQAVFEMDVPLGSFTDDQVRQLLRALAAKAGLNYDEIVGAYAKRRTKIANGLLDVHRDGPEPQYWCGHGPVFMARVVDENGKGIQYGADLDKH